MPPHCDSMDGPVVLAAKRALAAKDIALVLPYVKKSAEEELTEAFERVVAARQARPAAEDVADRYFYETAVRLHRAGEGAAFTGIKPAGLDVGPVIPLAERAIETGSAEDVTVALASLIGDNLRERLQHVIHLKTHADDSLEHARAYVEAMLDLQVYAHSVYIAAISAEHEGGHRHG